MSSISVSGVGSPYSSYQTNAANRKNDFQALANALNSNDLSSAQTAFAALQKDLSAAAGGQPAGQNGNSNNSPVATDFQNLSQALSSGDLSSAQSAFAKLQQDLKAQHAQHGGHHHHGGHHGGVISSISPTTSSQSSSSGTDSDGDHDGSTGQTSLNIQI